MFVEADSELDKIDPFCRALSEVLTVRLAIYRGLKKWELMQQIAKRLKEFDSDNVQWTISLAYATRRAYSIDVAMEILSQRRGEVSERSSNPIQSRVLSLPTWRNRKRQTLLKTSV